VITEHGAAPDWARWRAQDADGAIWVFEAEPLEHEQRRWVAVRRHPQRGWYENEVGRRLRLGQGAPNPDWRLTLVRLGA